ncbi:4-hydroxythreonine-4-phosphate dehydrogenase PdxA [Gracilimonas mengyeensis]|uniref:4-hydroxythreonine-4-phosphate dehydrogenase n=1 Tax=Gracilimonas mengyeensis TaxID=1302730 RepID=A0A521D844_9BACT|nr:4-hydroxythreonine-4-phosphate dehydrogenase PdxA [Gracilimonas mengyeensis]SMO67876.1 4-hydroxythreonine-4-phosphate dehydrogenase [Gracilimonas mengyeensis]
MIKKNIPRIAVSIGDFNGIGPEIVLKALGQAELNEATPVILTLKSVMDFYDDFRSPQQELHIAEKADEIENGHLNLLQIGGDVIEITPGTQTEQSGRVAMKAIEKGIELCLDKTTDALVTAPISKEAVNMAGYHIPGHTEFLAEKTSTKNVLMMLVSGNLRVALVTAHTPIKDVSEEITAQLIRTKIGLLHESLRKDFGIDNPRIAVFGLNPHAGDGGVIGTEEVELIGPLVQALRHEGMGADGPFPADGFFGQQLHKEYDAILAMYHDQGLAPFKLLSFGRGVNFTAGLPIIRTSPDHGTAFDIAGKGKANPSSFTEAWNLAIELANKKLREH